MTTLQKAIITAAIVAAAGTAVYEAREASTLEAEVQVLRAQQASLAAQIEQLNSEHGETERQPRPDANSKRLDPNTSELLRLRGEVGVLRSQIAAMKATKEAATDHIQFREPFLRRETWVDRGTDNPMNTILTMFWAMSKGEEAKLKEIELPRGLFTFFKLEWDKIQAVQVVRVVTTRAVVDGRAEDGATAEVIVEKAPFAEGALQDVSMERWSLKKMDGRWRIMGWQ